MVDDDVLLPDRREAIAAMLANALGEARRIGLELQVRPLDRDKLLEIVDGEHAGDDVDLVVGDGERALHHGAQRVGHRLLDLQPDHHAAAAPLQRALEEADEILRLLLDLDVRVADEPERALAAHLIAGEQTRDEQADRVLKHHEAEPRRRIGRARKLDEALEAVRETDERLHGAAVLSGKLQRQRKAEIGNERKRMRRVDGERRQDGKNRRQEMSLQPVEVGCVQRVGADDGDARLGKPAATAPSSSPAAARPAR